MKVLVIQQKMIGDVLTTSILCEAIKNYFPEAEIHYVVNTHTFPVVEQNPFIDEIKFFTPEMEKSKGKFLGFLKSLRRAKYDIVIDAYSKTSSNLMALFSGASKKISKHKSYTSFLYHHTFEDAKISKTSAGLAIENRMQYLKPLGIDNIAPLKPKIYLSNNELLEAQDFLKENGIDTVKPIYMVSVLGSDLSKTYPFQHMAKTLDVIVENKPNAQILFNYIPKQALEAKAIFELCSPKTKTAIFFDVFGKSLRQFLTLTKYCTALIGNEGGAVNMAKALDIPTFTIFSPWIKKEAWSLFEDGKHHVSVHLKDYAPQLFTGKNTKELKATTNALYDQFNPDLFEEKLIQFLTGN